MPSSLAIRLQIEAALADRIPSALTPAPKVIRPVEPTGIPGVDTVLEGGLPLGAITEISGPECSGRTSVALGFIAHMTQAGRVCAWADASDALQPESAAAAGVDLARLLWVRCGLSSASDPARPAPHRFALPHECFVAAPAIKGLHGGGFGPHPHHEIKGLADAVSGFLRPRESAAPCMEPRSGKLRCEASAAREALAPDPCPPIKHPQKPFRCGKPWARIEQALRVTDLLLQAGGFSAIVLDLGSIAPQYALQVPLATWFRYRAAAERSQAAILLLTQHACAKSSAGLALRLQPGNALHEEAAVLTGVAYRVAVERERFPSVPSHTVPPHKLPQSIRDARWRSRTAWAGSR